MAQVKYHGEFPEGQDEIVHLGETFSRDKATDVKDKATLQKLAQNRFFEVSGESDKDAVNQGKGEAENAEAETLKAWLTDHQVPFHHKLGRDKLQGLKDDYLKAQEKAQAE